VNHSFIDEHSHIDSILSCLDPRTKVVSFFVFIFFIVFTSPESTLSFALYGLLLIVLILLSHIPLMYILKRCLVIIPFILMTSIFLLYEKQGEKISLMQIGSLSLTFSKEGWLIFKGVMIKGILSVLCLTLLTACTPFPRLLLALESFKVPKVITMILSFMYRYIFLIEDEAMKMWRAMKARSAGHSRLLHFKAIANMIGILFIRSFERGEAVYLAMCSRGFNGTLKHSACDELKGIDFAFLFNIFFVLISINFLDNFLGR
jgi:cobalt/nickel transport system permease protein